jgi:hypothetical protein
MQVGMYEYVSYVCRGLDIYGTVGVQCCTMLCTVLCMDGSEYDVMWRWGRGSFIIYLFIYFMLWVYF